MKKYISYFAITLCVAISLSSCEKEDNNNSNNEGNNPEGAFIEVTINEKTYRDEINDFLFGNLLEEWGKESLLHTFFSLFRDYGFEISICFTCYNDLEKLLDCPLGEYPYSCVYDSENESDNLSFHIESYETPDGYITKSKGSHKVTRISKEKFVQNFFGETYEYEKIAIEGTFNVIMGDNEVNIKGKYRFLDTL